MKIAITWNGNSGSEPQLTAVISETAASLGLESHVILNRTKSGGDGKQPAAAEYKDIVFTEVPDREIARHRLALAAGIRTVLFVCTGNAMRSQMAEAIVNHLFCGTWAAFSAGVMPMDIPGNVATVMREIGIDTARQRSKHVDLFGTCSFDLIVILCSDADRICPNLPDCRKQEHLIFDDPLASAMISEGAFFSLKSSLRSLRDEMKSRLPAYLKDR